MLPPETLICLAGSGLGAGPASTPVEWPASPSVVPVSRLLLFACAAAGADAHPPSIGNGPQRRAVHAKVTAFAPSIVAERNERGGPVDSQERDFGHSERVLASNNGDEMVSGEADVWHGADLAKQIGGQRRRFRLHSARHAAPGREPGRRHLHRGGGAHRSADQAGAVVIELPRHLADLSSYPVAMRRMNFPLPRSLSRGRGEPGTRGGFLLRRGTPGASLPLPPGSPRVGRVPAGVAAGARPARPRDEAGSGSATAGKHGAPGARRAYS